MFEKKDVDATGQMFFVAVSEQAKARKGEHHAEVFEFGYGELRSKLISIQQKDKIIRMLKRICGIEGDEKQTAVVERNGRGGIKFIYCEGVRITLHPCEPWGCKG